MIPAEEEGVRGQVHDTHKIMLRDIGELSEDAIKGFFEKYGSIVHMNTKVVNFRDTQTEENAAWIQFENQDGPNTILSELGDETEIDGKSVKVNKVIHRKNPSAHDSYTLFVQNIAHEVQEDELRSLFEKYGPVQNISNVPR